jgi:hypothetical protein
MTHINIYIYIHTHTHTHTHTQDFGGFWWGNLRIKDHWVDPGVDGRIILRRIFRKWDVGVWTRSS